MQEAQRELEQVGLVATVKPEETKTGDQPTELKEEPKGVTFNSDDIKKCMHCNANLKHSEVVLLIVDNTNKVLAVHTKCLEGAGARITQISQVHVHLEEGKKVSSVQQLIIKKKAKEIFKRAKKSEQKVQEEKAREVKV